MAKRHQAVEKMSFGHVLKKNAVSCHGCCSLAKANILYTYFFKNALELFLSKLAAARFCGFEYISKNLHDCT